MATRTRTSRLNDVNNKTPNGEITKGKITFSQMFSKVSRTDISECRARDGVKTEHIVVSPCNHAHVCVWLKARGLDDSSHWSCCLVALIRTLSHSMFHKNFLAFLTPSLHSVWIPDRNTSSHSQRSHARADLLGARCHADLASGAKPHHAGRTLGLAAGHHLV